MAAVQPAVSNLVIPSMTRLEIAGCTDVKTNPELSKNRKMDFLGYTLDADIIRPKEESMDKMVEMKDTEKKLKNKNQVRSFFGVVNYYSSMSFGS